MAIAGLRGSGDWGTDERPTNFREMILWRRPAGSAPLTALMARMGSEAVDDPQYTWWEEELNLVRLTINYSTGFSTTDTSLTVLATGAQTGQDLVPGDLLLVEGTGVQNASYNNEIVVVSAITSSSVIVVARAYGAASADGAATPIADAASLTKIGNVFSEGATSPSVASRNPTKMYNYCQIFKTAYELTNTAKKTKACTGDPLKNDKKRKMFDHSVALEQAFIFGRRWEGTGANGKPQRMTGGLLHTMATYYSSIIKR